MSAVRVLRRRLARRWQLVRVRTATKSEVHAVLQRQLQGRPPCSDLFGVKGRQWLANLQLPCEERESVDAAVRHIEFLDAEIALVEKLVAQQALSWPEIRRLMTVPGVNLICAATFIAAVGNPNRFLTSRKLVAYLGLDPKVKQSGQAPARSGRISKLGSGSARRTLTEAAWTAVLQPGPLHAFYHRRRPQIHPSRRRHLVHQRPHARSRTRARPTGRDLIQAHGQRPASRSPGKDSGRERDTAARIGKSLNRGQAARQTTSS
jgi:transposase